MAREYLETKVTVINGRFHCRLLQDGKVKNEMVCKLKQDIGFCMSYMLRMHDKCGGSSEMADRSRHRQKNGTATGKVWYPSQIPVKGK